MKITTWNINSVRLRLPSLQRVVETISPDIICLQELQVVTELFPYKESAAFGYPHQAVSGMKGYNGVAILSRLPLTEISTKNWCGREDCRHIFATVECRDLGPLEIHNFYIPAGGDIPDPKVNEKFDHKLKFLDEVAAWQKEPRGGASNQVLVGDINNAPLETDVWSHKQLQKRVSHTPM